ncbi:hypothetical protein N307_03753, partial [Dryobates pubescens]
MPKLLTAPNQKGLKDLEWTQAHPHHWAEPPRGDPASKRFSPSRSMQRRSGERQQLGPGPSDPAASPCGTSRPQPRQVGTH